MTAIRKSLLFLTSSFWVIFFVLFCTPAQAADSVIYPGALPVLIGIDKVQEDLKLSSLQKVVLNSIRNEYRAEAQQVYASAHFTNPASRISAQNAICRLQLKYNQRVLSTLNQTQKNKLWQIELQILGGFLLLKNSIQQCLRVDNVQKVKIAKIQTKYSKALQNLNRLSVQKKIPPMKRAMLLHNLRSNSSNTLLEILTPAQKKHFSSCANKNPSLMDWCLNPI